MRDPQRYLDLFVAESREHLASASRVAARLDRDADAEAVREAFRHLHSVKGMAATMGFASRRDVAHAAEGVLDACRNGLLDAARAGALVGEATACLERLVDRAARGEADDDAAGSTLAARLRDAAGAAFRSDPGGSADPSPSDRPRATARLWRVAMRLDRERPFPAMRAAALLGGLGRLGRVVASSPPAARLRTGRCDDAIAATLETTLEGAPLAAALARLPELASFTLAPLGEAPEPKPAPASPWTRLPVATIDAWLADANELVRALTRAGADPRAIALARRLRRRSLDARLLPFDSLAGRLERAAGDIARGVGKEMAVEVAGRETPVDRTLLDALADPLLHLVRNAVDHGLEFPAEREAAGRPRRGTLRIAVARRASGLVIAVEDDGRGVDLEGVRVEAVRRGFRTEAAANALDEAGLLALLIEPGFSTSRTTGILSGRGVGLDVVAEAVRQHGGRLALDARPGRGLSVRMTFPFAAWRLQAIVVRCGDARLALPAAAVRRVAPAGSEPVPTLASRLGDPDSCAAAVAVEIRRTTGTITLAVQAVEGRHELVLRPLRGPLASRGPYAAVGVLDDGGPVVVIDPEAL